MLVSNLDVTFTFGGSNVKTKKCDYVIFGIEFIGDVKEDTAFELHEDYNNARETIKLKVKLNLAETNWIGEFLKATDKIITIDSEDYAVVNDGKKVEMKLFKDSLVGTHPELKFKRKTPGITSVGYIGSLATPGQFEGVVT